MTEDQEDILIQSFIWIFPYTKNFYYVHSELNYLKILRSTFLPEDKMSRKNSHKNYY